MSQQQDKSPITGWSSLIAPPSEQHTTIKNISTRTEITPAGILNIAEFNTDTPDPGLVQIQVMPDLAISMIFKTLPNENPHLRWHYCPDSQHTQLFQNSVVDSWNAVLVGHAPEKIKVLFAGLDPNNSVWVYRYHIPPENPRKQLDIAFVYNLPGDDRQSTSFRWLVRDIPKS